MHDAARPWEYYSSQASPLRLIQQAALRADFFAGLQAACDAGRAISVFISLPALGRAGERAFGCRIGHDSS